MIRWARYIWILGAALSLWLCACETRKPPAPAPDPAIRKLMQAVLDDDLDRAEKQINNDAGLSGARDEEGMTALHWAAAKGRLAIARMLLARGSKVEAVNGLGRTPLHLAAIKGHVELVNLLLESGAQVNALDQEKESPLGWALFYKERKTSEILRNHGGKIGKDVQAALDAAAASAKPAPPAPDGTDLPENPDATAALWRAIKENKWPEAAAALAQGANWRTRDEHGNSPLALAVYQDQVDFARKILQEGADPQLRDKFGNTLLHYAGSRGHARMALMLAQMKAEISAVNDEGRTPLHLAVLFGHSEVAMQLLELGADPAAKDRQGITSLDMARKKKDAALTALLQGKQAGEGSASIKPGVGAGDPARSPTDPPPVTPGNPATPAHPPAAGRNAALLEPLILATKKGNLSLSKKLVKDGADVNGYDKNGLTPLHWAARSGHVEIVRFLLDQNARINIRTTDVNRPAGDGASWTPMDYAVQMKRPDVVSLLGSRGGKRAAELEKMNQAGADAAIQQATQGLLEDLKKGDFSRLARHLAAGADVNGRDQFGNSPILLASTFGDVNAVNLLISHGSKVDVPNDRQETPLMWAAARGHMAIVRVLVDKGAAVKSLNKLGQSALHLASGGEKVEMVEYLLSKGAEVNLKSKLDKTPLDEALAAKNSAIIDLLKRHGARPGKEPDTRISTPQTKP